MILIFSVVLFVTACVPPDAHAADQCCDSMSTQQTHISRNISKHCLELHNTLCDKNYLRVHHRHNQYIFCEDELNRKLLEETVKSETERRKCQYQQADILEKLLLESIISEADSIRQSSRKTLPFSSEGTYE